MGCRMGVRQSVVWHPTLNTASGQNSCSSEENEPLLLTTEFFRGGCALRIPYVYGYIGACCDRGAVSCPPNASA